MQAAVEQWHAGTQLCRTYALHQDLALHAKNTFLTACFSAVREWSSACSAYGQPLAELSRAACAA